MNNEINEVYAPDYVVDAFTKKESNINIEVDNANVSCITSKNNKFSLDEEGNLTVNSINYNSNNTIIDALSFYPIGSIYMSVLDVEPTQLFGGIWERFATGRTLVGVDTAQEEFNITEKVGGEKSHILSTEELPSHTHSVTGGAHKHTYTGFINVSATTNTTYQCIAHKRYTADGVKTPPSMNSSGAHSHTLDSVGNDSAHNNLQPYITCYMWKRVA